MWATRYNGEADRWSDPVGVGPQQQHFIGRPDRHAAREGMKHIIVGLVAEQKGRRPFLRPLSVVFERGSLLAPDIEPKVPCPVDQDG